MVGGDARPTKLWLARVGIRWSRNPTIGTGRLEAFSDAVIAILITVMVLELKIPHGTGIHALRPLVPIGLTYVLSFTFLGIYWNNHRHMLHGTGRVNGKVLWANLHLLFWLSLIPVATGWVGTNGFASLPVAMYGVVLFADGTAYYILERTIVSSDAKNALVAEAVARPTKEKLSVLVYAVAIPIAFADRWVSLALYVAVALMWIVPDRRFERAFERDREDRRALRIPPATPSSSSDAPE
ncbi:MAG: TMEM175 family protein [Acidimicrobiales bacterium]